MSAATATLDQPMKLDINIEAPFIKVVQECIIKSKLIPMTEYLQLSKATKSLSRRK